MSIKIRQRYILHLGACLKNAGDDVRSLNLAFISTYFSKDLSLVTSAPTEEN